ncbi:MAG: F0F1 ATP synthase subunit B [Bacteroidia bacterium]|nr:F0F1 ATP synthase subunit B [Bacteroidia bacterium]MDW8157429.1 F0F1 ATP synthase subunit B [Bacteroidia bacterium]
MEIILPKFGLFFWTVVIFLTFFLILRKVAWKPILRALQEREQEIEARLQAAAEAQKKMEQITQQNEKMLQEALLAKEKILKEAQELKAQIENQARQEARLLAEKMRKETLQEVEQIKKSLKDEIKKEVVEMSFYVAEKILSRELRNKKTHDSYVEALISDLQLNPKRVTG